MTKLTSRGWLTRSDSLGAPHAPGDLLPSSRDGPERIGETRVFQMGIQHLRRLRIAPKELVQRLVILVDKLVEL